MITKGFKYHNLISDLTKKLVFWYFGKLVVEETRGGRLQEVVTTRHLTVYNYYRAMFFNNAKTHGQKGANVKYIFEQEN